MKPVDFTMSMSLEAKEHRRSRSLAKCLVKPMLSNFEMEDLEVYTKYRSIED